ncbi:BSD domain-containing protein 1-like isoform X2 [Conger conger]|uniref:BSD domain-containing protein 1-like isoform X2 n=1 Tax=Conger conger TaxID=82655 RepID=UPI002A5A0AF1|nr:BSD domain-containing protein 1-like isoform X2 [Conger conger]
MAEGDEGWWGGWLQQSFQAVKDKSAEAYEFIKRDLTEFSSVVQQDTACSIAATATAVRGRLAVERSSEATDKVKKSLSNILGVITDTLVPPPDKTIDCNVITLVATPAGTTEVYDSVKARLYSLQADPATYCSEPDGPPEQFEAWFCSFSLEEKKGEISELLVSSPSIRALYTKMVPVAVSHSEFWQRYFYRVFQLDQEEERRLALKRRAEKSTDSEGLDWEEEEDEFMVATFTSRSHLKSQEESCFTSLCASPAPPVLTLPAGPPDAGPLTGSETLGLEQVGADEELALRLTEASAEDPGPDRGPSLLGTGRVAATGESSYAEVELEPATKTAETLRGDGSHDLRVYELHSDSGKSSPSISDKEGWSTDVSEDWEKDFDLDMTEEEVKLALAMNTDGELDDEDWENWD